MVTFQRPLQGLECACLCAQQCLALCDPVGCNPPGSYVRGISHCSGLLFPSLACLSDPGIKPASAESPALAGISLLLSHLGSPIRMRIFSLSSYWMHTGFLQLGRVGATPHCSVQALWWLLLLLSVGSRACWLLQLQLVGLVIATHWLQSRVSSCGSQAWLPSCIWDLCSQTRHQTHIPCIARQILNHWATRKMPKWEFKAREKSMGLGKVMK